MTLQNDQVMPELAKDFGAAMQVNSGVIEPNIQATALVEEYRRVFRTTREIFVTDGVSTKLTFTYINRGPSVRRYSFMRFQSSAPDQMLIVGEVQRGTNARLIQEVMSGVTAGNQSTIICGKYAQLFYTQVAQSWPEEILQPGDSDLRIVMTRAAGGAIPARSVTLESGYWREPPLRAWLAGPPDSIVQA